MIRIPIIYLISMNSICIELQIVLGFDESIEKGSLSYYIAQIFSLIFYNNIVYYAILFYIILGSVVLYIIPNFDKQEIFAYHDALDKFFRRFEN